MKVKRYVTNMGFGKLGDYRNPVYEDSGVLYKRVVIDEPSMYEGSVDKLCDWAEEIQNKCDGYVQTYFRAKVVEEYGDHNIQLEIIGYKKLTEDEIVEYTKNDQKSKEKDLELKKQHLKLLEKEIKKLEKE